MSEDGMEQKYVKEAFDTNWVVPLGPNVNGFEKDLEEFVGKGKRVVALSAGTAAVHLGLLNCGVKPGDEVIVVQEEQDGHKVIRRMRHAVIVSVSKHVILTDCGCFQDKEVYLWQGLKKQ